MEARATARFMRVSPRKARLVVDRIRGKNISDAKTVLLLANKACARTVKKVLDSQENFKEEFAFWREMRGGVAPWPKEMVLKGKLYQ
jgi:ribosomal protein L22